MWVDGSCNVIRPQGLEPLQVSTKNSSPSPETAEVTEQVIEINFEDTGGTENLADTFLDEFFHADQNVESKGTTTTGEDHALKDKEKKDTDFERQVHEHIEKDD